MAARALMTGGGSLRLRMEGQCEFFRGVRLAGLGIPVADVTIAQRVIQMLRAQARVSPVLEADPRSEAAREIMSLARSLIHSEIRAAA
jgi:hypothetical protein